MKVLKVHASAYSISNDRLSTLKAKVKKESNFSSAFKA
jgi:hypothetical protein